MNRKNLFTQSLMEIIRSNAQHHPNKDAISDSQIHYNYAQLLNEIDHQEKIIGQLGLQEGRVAIIQLPNRAITLVLLISLLNQGIKPLFAAPALRIKEIEALRKKTSADYYFFPEEYDNSDYFTLAEELTNNTDYHFRAFKVGKESICPALSNQYPMNVVKNNDCIAFMTSSGSTGLPKVISLTDKQFTQRCTKLKSYFSIDQDTRFLAYLSIMYPMTLLSPGVLTTLLHGGSVFLADRAETEIQTLLSSFEQKKITHSALVPSFAAEFVRTASQGKFRFDSLKLMEIGGEPLSDTLAQSIKECFNCQLFEIYGMTEGFGFSTIRSDIAIPRDELNFEYRIVPETGDTSGHKATCGELHVRSEESFSGYYNENNDESFSRDGWFITGDIVEIDEHAQIISAKRKNNVINKRGTKISCHEVEELLEEISFIEKVAVLPYPCKDVGQKICAFIKGRDFSTQQIRDAFTKLGVSEIKFPDKFIFMEALPLNSRLKIDRNKLLNYLNEH